MTWGQAIKASIIALPKLAELALELLGLIKPILQLVVAWIGPHPEKRAVELGDALRLLAESGREENPEKKKQKKYEALQKLADFARSH